MYELVFFNKFQILILKLVSSAFAMFFTEISVVRGTEISVKSSAKADETSYIYCYFLFRDNYVHTSIGLASQFTYS